MFLLLASCALTACGSDTDPQIFTPDPPGRPPAGVLSRAYNGLTGHLGVALNNGQPEFGFEYGISYYSTVFSLNSQQAEGTQLGWGSWLIPDNRSFSQPLCPVGTYARDHWPERGPTYRDVYQTIEGGVGQWTTTRFASGWPKFRANSTPDCYSSQIATPGWEFYTNRLGPDNLGLAQLSNRLVLPPDGITMDVTGTSAVLGYGWFALPIVPAGLSTSGAETGDQSWTLFLRAANFSGPVAFFTPATWSAVNSADRTGEGRGHDARPAYHPQVALEIGNTPVITARDSLGVLYRRIPRLTFPVEPATESVLLRDVRFYSKQALWDGVSGWIEGGTPVTEFRSAGVVAPSLGSPSFGISFQGSRVPAGAGFDAAVIETEGGPAFGLRWSGDMEPGVFPEFYRRVGDTWRPIPAESVPPETTLAEQTFVGAPRSSIEGLDVSASSPWSSSGWAAGPSTAQLSDGSMVDYVWYRFVDQPAIARLGLDAAQRARLQAWAESLHERSGLQGLSFAPPGSGALAILDGAVLVAPPEGLEKGYVPIVIRQY